MTKKILLALALTLGSAAAFTPPAFACGGYGQIDPDEVQIRQVVHRTARAQLRDDANFWIASMERDGERATVVLIIERNEQRREHELRLRRVEDTWRVVRIA